MKKLIMAVAIVCAAVVTQAASYSWQSGVISDHTGAQVGSGAVTAYLFTIDATAYGKYSALAADKLTTTLWDAYGATLSIAQATKDSAATGKANISYGEPVAGHQYAALIYVDNNSDPTYVMGNVADINWSGTGAAQASNLAQFVGGGTSGTATSWQSVPEPTSGLLLLLGMAGLALKRKRA